MPAKKGRGPRTPVKAPRKSRPGKRGGYAKKFFEAMNRTFFA